MQTWGNLTEDASVVLKEKKKNQSTLKGTSQLRSTIASTIRS